MCSGVPGRKHNYSQFRLVIRDKDDVSVSTTCLRQYSEENSVEYFKWITS